ncbi:GntR family transcriptional regulator [Natribacillus halophilus]|uniref:DNA-binding transcriptional regulator, GntR family n=1 Tax=Natribacillus halophilus TaxID=549003 RepID=A0A1G8RC56_9BACI|nr:GntR family transcriptional regulator [Natribacillus halophilus]SDJ14602.1 DNA-binding transcriptional regulator, GntR family [Natribacillus halophilus]
MPNEENFDLSIDINSYKSLSELTLDKLREAIVSGFFKPGDHLKERELSKLLNISTTPIKEALKILSSEGLVETVPRKGSFVSSIANVSIEEVLLTRANLDGLCARFATLKFNDNELYELEHMITEAEKSIKSEDYERIEEINTVFHEKIRYGAKNPMLHTLLNNVLYFDRAFRRRALKHTEEINTGYEEHKQILEALKERDQEKVELLMKNHIERTAQNVLRILEEKDYSFQNE